LIAARQPRALFARFAPPAQAVQVDSPTSTAGRSSPALATESSAHAAARTRSGSGRRARPEATIDVWSVVKSAPWQIVLFSLGMYLVVYGLRNEGLTDQLGQVLAGLAQHGDVATATGTGFLVAGMSSVMNNMPTTLIAALGIDAAAISGLSEQMMV